MQEFLGILEKNLQKRLIRAVVQNHTSAPPFSLFREYVAQLMKYEKKFLVVGNMNAVTYKEIFALLKENKIWIGYGFNLSMIFRTTYTNTLDANRKYVISKGYDPDKNYVKTPAIAWFTNLDIKKRHEDLILIKHYTPEEYPHYDNYDAINVNSTSDIPCDYSGTIGVPITFLDKKRLIIVLIIVISLEGI